MPDVVVPLIVKVSEDPEAFVLIEIAMPDLRMVRSSRALDERSFRAYLRDVGFGTVDVLIEGARRRWNEEHHTAAPPGR